MVLADALHGPVELRADPLALSVPLGTPPAQSPPPTRARSHEHPAATTSRTPLETYYLDVLVAPSGPPRRPGALVASATFGWRAMLKVRHDPKQLVDVIAIPVVFTVLFTYIFGGALIATAAITLVFAPLTLHLYGKACTA
jgi:hypothetical protein